MNNIDLAIKSGCEGLPANRLQTPRLEELDLPSVQKGIIFILALWSGQARASFRLLCRELSLSKPPDDLTIMVINIDEYDPLTLQHILGMRPPSGVGETIWIKAGKILFIDNGYTDEPSQNVGMCSLDLLRKRIAEFS